MARKKDVHPAEAKDPGDPLAHVERAVSPQPTAPAPELPDAWKTPPAEMPAPPKRVRRFLAADQPPVDPTQYTPGTQEHVDACRRYFDQVADCLADAAEAWHDLEEIMPGEKEKATARLVATKGLSPSAADKAAGTDPVYNALRATRREIEARKLRLENLLTSAKLQAESAQDTYRRRTVIHQVDAALATAGER